MKKLQIILWLSITTIAFGQKVDLDRYTFTAQFRTLPAVQLDSTYRTYNVTVETTKLMQTYLDEMTPEKTVLLDGWRRLEETGHVTIKVKIEDILPESVSVKERVENIKDRTGRITGTKSMYSQEVVYTFSATAYLEDYKGVHIEDFVLADRGSKLYYRSPEFPIQKLAEGYFMINALTITRDLFKSNVNRAMRNLSDRISNLYGFGEAQVTDQMWILDSKKHPEYQAHRAAFQQLTAAIFTLTADKPIDGLREQLKPVIAYFEGIKRKYNSNSKWDRKLRYASYYNLAVIYYYLDDPDAMLKEATGLIMNDYDSGDGKNFEYSALRLKNIFRQSGIYTRHFPININNFRGPFEKAVTQSK